MSGPEEVSGLKVFFDDPEFDGQFARTLGKTAVGMADVGECLAAASRMTAGDYGSWRDSWRATAERVERIADEAARAGRRRSAGEAHLRAAEYHRASYFFEHVDLTGSFLHSAWEATRRCFLAEFDLDAGEWSHCEDVALSRYDQVVHDWLDGVLAS